MLYMYTNVHVHDVDSVIGQEISLVTIALVSIKLKSLLYTDTIKVVKHELHNDVCAVSYTHLRAHETLR